jgi:diguanylate cyclase (GGDEF)-like protein
MTSRRWRPQSRARPSVLAERDRSLADRDQTVSETDQTLSDADQSASENDQTRAESDQAAADNDQVASDHDLAAGVSREAYEFSRDIRRRSAHEREQSARERLRVAAQRDAVAHLRDLSAMARDRAANARDAAMAQIDAGSEQQEGTRALTGIELVARAAEQRRRAAQLRARAANHRALAAEDRSAAARDRELAASQRRQALLDREALAAEVDRAAIDGLTSARTRTAGLRELDNELDRARRSGSALVVAYLDVVGLKKVNDTIGHSAGDALLKRVVASIKAHVRPYDLVIRVGGDEFLCVMSNLNLEDARKRFHAIATAVNQASQPGEIRVGFAQLLNADESTTALIARADGELIRMRRSRGEESARPEDLDDNSRPASNTMRSRA